MIIKCGECEAEVSDRAASCPKCGAPVGPTASEKIKASCRKAARSDALLWFGILAFGVGATLLLYYASAPPAESGPGFSALKQRSEMNTIATLGAIGVVAGIVMVAVRLTFGKTLTSGTEEERANGPDAVS